MEDVSTNVQEITKLVKDIKIHKSSAIENISSFVLKDAFMAIINQITYLFNIALSTGVFPRKWKVAQVIPLPKSGDPNDVNNLRPISLLTLPGKLLEKIIHKALSTYCETNHLLNKDQGGYRKEHSTIDTVAKLTDDIFNAINLKETTLATFIDFKKAFDTVDHKILLLKLKNLGISNLMYKLLTCYLTNRQQFILVNGVKSDTVRLTYGIPQGSILGPLLFLVYINDINDNFEHCNVKLFADDTVLYVSYPCSQIARNKLQSDLDVLANWCELNKITINVNKTKAMIFGTKATVKRATKRELSLYNKRIDYIGVYKYLGLFLDSHLMFNKQLNEMVKTTAFKTHQLAKVRKYINKQTALSIYKSMILPYFDYGDILIISSHQNQLNKLQKVQNRALRICLHKEPRSQINNLHYEGDIPLLSFRRHSHLLNYMYRRKDDLSYRDSRNINTRFHSSSVLNVIKPNCETFKRSVCYKGALAWNNLDPNTKCIKAYESFKKQQKNWLRSMIPVPL